ncbi:hypothetical protein CR513_30627, partial [Mucuna pruriens]
MVNKLLTSLPRPQPLIVVINKDLWARQSGSDYCKGGQFCCPKNPNCLRKLGGHTSYHDQLVSFVGERVDSQGYVNLLATFNNQQTFKTICGRYLLVNPYTSYNILIGKVVLNELGAIVSTPHLAMKFPYMLGKS